MNYLYTNIIYIFIHTYLLTIFKSVSENVQSNVYILCIIINYNYNIYSDLQLVICTMHAHPMRYYYLHYYPIIIYIFKVSIFRFTFYMFLYNSFANISIVDVFNPVKIRVDF